MKKEKSFCTRFVSFTTLIFYICTFYLLIAAFSSLSQVSMAQSSGEVRASLFSKADQALHAAKSAKADLLAPKAFQEGMKYYQQAEKMFERGKEISSIQTKLDTAIGHFQKSMEAVKIASATFDKTISARENALAADSPVHEPQLWSMAEEMFLSAAGDLEKGYLKQAQKEASRAADKYNESELKSIKSAYLSKGLQLIEQAKMEDAEEYAPKTLAHAQQLIQKAATQLTADRYQTEEPKRLATEAKREAIHALTISKIAKRMDDKYLSLEDLILQHENLLRQISETLQIETSFERGLEESVSDILKTIGLYRDGEQAQVEALQNRVQKLGQDVSSRDDMIEDLERKLTQHEKELRSAEEQAFSYAQQIAEQEEIRRTFLEVEGMFDPATATVLRRENEVIIQMSGLNFPSGKSTIEPQYFSLLTQVQKAIDLFPKSQVIVAGHTDSIGAEKQNLELSQERADTVKQYFLANMGISEERIKAIGYGESQPIASNDTKEGRERNRRIDIIIQPKSLVPLQHEAVLEKEDFPEEIDE